MTSFPRHCGQQLKSNAMASGNRRKCVPGCAPNVTIRSSSLSKLRKNPIEFSEIVIGSSLPVKISRVVIKRAGKFNFDRWANGSHRPAVQTLRSLGHRILANPSYCPYPQLNHIANTQRTQQLRCTHALSFPNCWAFQIGVPSDLNGFPN